MNLQPETIVTVGAVALTTSSFTCEPPHPHVAANFCLDVTAAATDAGDTLDVTVQARVAGQWVDVCHFTQVLGNGGAKKHFAKIVASEPQATFENATALASGAVRHLLGDAYRMKYVVVDGDANSSFTFKVTGSFNRY